MLFCFCLCFCVEVEMDVLKLKARTLILTSRVIVLEMPRKTRLDQSEFQPNLTYRFLSTILLKSRVIPTYKEGGN